MSSNNFLTESWCPYLLCESVCNQRCMSVMTAKKELERERIFIFIHSFVNCFISTPWQALDLGILKIQKLNGLSAVLFKSFKVRGWSRLDKQVHEDTEAHARDNRTGNTVRGILREGCILTLKFFASILYWN